MNQWNFDPRACSWKAPVMIEQSKSARDYELPVRLSLGRYARGREQVQKSKVIQNELTRVFERRFSLEDHWDRPRNIDPCSGGDSGALFVWSSKEGVRNKPPSDETAVYNKQSDPGHRAKSSNARIRSYARSRRSRINIMTTAFCAGPATIGLISLGAYGGTLRAPFKSADKDKERKNAFVGSAFTFDFEGGFQFAWWEGLHDSHLPVQQRKWRRADSELEDAAEPRDWSIRAIP